MRAASHERPHGVWSHGCEVSKLENPDTDRRLGVARAGGGGRGDCCMGRGPLLGMLSDWVEAVATQRCEWTNCERRILT